jgi:hypothetical protein
VEKLVRVHARETSQPKPLQPDEAFGILLIVDLFGLEARKLLPIKGPRRTAAEHRPLASVSAVAQVREGLCSPARLVVGASVAVPRRRLLAEQFLEGRPLDADTIEQAAQLVAEGIDPISDLRGSAEYRREMVRISAKRTMESLIQEAPAKERS